MYVCVDKCMMVVVVGGLTASMLAAMLVARAVSTGLCIGFHVVWIRLCVCVCVYIMDCYVTITYFNGIVVVVYTFGNLCFIIKDTYMKHK